MVYSGGCGNVKAKAFVSVAADYQVVLTGGGFKLEISVKAGVSRYSFIAEHDGGTTYRTSRFTINHNTGKRSGLRKNRQHSR